MGGVLCGCYVILPWLLMRFLSPNRGRGGGPPGGRGGYGEFARNFVAPCMMSQRVLFISYALRQSGVVGAIFKGGGSCSDLNSCLGAWFNFV